MMPKEFICFLQDSARAIRFRDKGDNSFDKWLWNGEWVWDDNVSCETAVGYYSDPNALIAKPAHNTTQPTRSSDCSVADKEADKARSREEIRREVGRICQKAKWPAPKAAASPRSSDGLLPCPFCGAAVHDDRSDCYYVIHDGDCFLSAGRGIAQEFGEAGLAKWNQRAAMA